MLSRLHSALDYKHASMVDLAAAQTACKSTAAQTRGAVSVADAAAAGAAAAAARQGRQCLLMRDGVHSARCPLSTQSLFQPQKQRKCTGVNIERTRTLLTHTDRHSSRDADDS